VHLLWGLKHHHAAFDWQKMQYSLLMSGIAQDNEIKGAQHSALSLQKKRLFWRSFFESFFSKA
jgi:hypothetical protein